jgi:hypothetical protein
LGVALINNEEEHEVNYSKKAKKAKLLSLVPIFINVASVASVFFGIICERDLSFILFAVGCVLPIIGFIFSIYVRKKYHFYVNTYMFTYILNILLYLGYDFIILIIGFLYIVFGNPW